jgi:two-component system, LuxR family, response regulator FixJ
MPAPEIVHIIDDDDGVRESLCALLEAKNYAVMSHRSCEEFLTEYSFESSLCVVADLWLPGMSGLDLQKHLQDSAVDLPFVVITGHGDVSSAVRALKAGAVDFIEKPIDGELFVAAVDKSISTRLLLYHNLSSVNSAREKVAALTPRERDVLIHLVEGSPNKIIAYQLNISPRTVENHRARLMVKMNVDSVAELVKLALASGITTESAADHPKP